VEVSMSY